MRRRRSKALGEERVITIAGGRIPMVALIQTLAVAEYLSFRGAAHALGTNQSSVSLRIRALEQDLGIILFDRKTRGVRLTETGRRFVDQVDDAVEILDHAIKTAGMRARRGRRTSHRSSFSRIRRVSRPAAGPLPQPSCWRWSAHHRRHSKRRTVHGAGRPA